MMKCISIVVVTLKHGYRILKWLRLRHKRKEKDRGEVVCCESAIRESWSENAGWKRCAEQIKRLEISRGERRRCRLGVQIVLARLGQRMIGEVETIVFFLPGGISYVKTSGDDAETRLSPLMCQPPTYFHQGLLSVK